MLTIFKIINGRNENFSIKSKLIDSIEKKVYIKYSSIQECCIEREKERERKRERK